MRWLNEAEYRLMIERPVLYGAICTVALLVGGAVLTAVLVVAEVMLHA